jgi:hypothetical protein
MMLGSYQSFVGIDRPEGVSEREGSEVIAFWANAILADLCNDLNAMTPDVAVARAPAVARKARRWFDQAWRYSGPRERQFPITTFLLRVYEEPQQQGRTLVEIDVLTGTVR